MYRDSEQFFAEGYSWRNKTEGELSMDIVQADHI